MNNYELTLLLKKKESEATKEQVKKILQKYKVDLVSEDPWGIRKLAYQIETEKEAYYYFLNLTANSDSVKNMTNEFRLNRNIMRHLFVKVKKHSEPKIRKPESKIETENLEKSEV